VNGGKTVSTRFDVECRAVARNQIAFVSQRDDEDREIFLMNANGANVQQLTESTDRDRFPAWSPDDPRLAFQSNRDGTSADIYTMNLDGSGVQRITTSSAANFSPTPDGSEIAFVSDRDGNDEIYKINADGSGSATRLTNDPATDAFPHWSPKQ
jgi:TolB protein